MEPCQSPHQVGLSFAIRAVALLSLVEITAASLLAADSPLSEHMLARAVIALVAAVALLPRHTLASTRTVLPVLCWSVLCGVSIIPGLLWLEWAPGNSSRVFLLAGGCALLVFLFACFRWSLAVCFGDRRTAARVSLATLLLSLTLPLWASPLALLHGASKWFVDAIVALCPASYLAALSGMDYLRGEWMYQHAPYGSLRFDYPDPLQATLLILLLAAVFFTSARFYSPAHRSGRLPAIAPQLLEVKT